MKKQLIFAVIISLCSFGMIDIAVTKDMESTQKLELSNIEKARQDSLCKIEEEKLRKEQHHREELKNFLDAIGFRESGNRYHITNKWGYMGKYQFGKSTLKTIGFKVTRTEFLSNPQLQEEAMLALLLHNKKRLQKYIDVFDGQTINGILITESGILAAAHLGGQGSVKRYFKNGKVFRDGNGTKITSYMNKFSGYEIKLKIQS
jgi:hypothetical protein|tara:strand:- start:23138 stop:23749 length:612 start_codon:yes stop_codon:yes gene_type:complete